MNTGLKNLHLRRDSPSLRRFFARKVKNRRRPASLKYSYYKDGRVVIREINGKKQTYIYDLKNQLSSVRYEAGSALETYKYDASGNILEKVINGQKTNYSYDKGNQLASSTVNGIRTDYNYDAAGRMSSETTAGVTKSYTYGWLDKVVKVQAGDSVTTFSYYADGQLAERVQDGKKESFYWDELALLRRGDTNYINDPAVTGGNPILADNKILFIDMLGNTLDSVVFMDGIGTAVLGIGCITAGFTDQPETKVTYATIGAQAYEQATGSYSEPAEKIAALLDLCKSFLWPKYETPDITIKALQVLDDEHSGIDAINIIEERMEELWKTYE